MADLTQALTASIEAAQTGGEFVPRWRLPHEHDLRDIHAMLGRIIRGQRRLRAVAVLPMPEVP